MKMIVWKAPAILSPLLRALFAYRKHSRANTGKKPDT
jgi:hypothetical protein